MRRILLVLTVAALMAAMMVTAGPAKAGVNISSGGSGFSGGNFSSGSGGNSSNFNNSGTFISVGSHFDDIDFGGIGFGGIGFGGIEFDDDGDFEID